MAKAPPNILNLGSLHTLSEGGFGIKVDRDIEQAIKDCEDRPGLKTARKVVIELTITPEGEGGLSDTTMTVTATSKLSVPKAATRKQPMTIKRDKDTGQPQLIIPEAPTPIFDEDHHE
ncbi:hypothetical protein DM785_02595 [Deinococcus actinosclerus]|nr:hypothetical protein DM785_02595 [Deinococcus actinosclerus]